MRNWVLILISCAAALGQKVEQTFPAAKKVEVDNVWGSIRVAGYEGRDVRMIATRTNQGESPEDVRLEVTEREGAVRLYVDGPFRCHCRHGEEGWRDRSEVNYRVRYDFELRVPFDTVLTLRTVNDGEIVVENTRGDYDIQNVNGRIEMTEVSGSGKVRAINRPVKVVFRRNPAAASRFSTVNGGVELHFQPDLAADLRVKTLNGKILSDFPVTTLAPRAATSERREGKFVYRSDRYTGIRVGRGGPEIQLDSINGTIQILERSK